MSANLDSLLDPARRAECARWDCAQRQQAATPQPHLTLRAKLESHDPFRGAHARINTLAIDIELLHESTRKLREAIRARQQESKAARAWRVLRALYAKHAPAAVLRRAERLCHRLSIAEVA